MRSVVMKPGCRLLAVIPDPEVCARRASSLENRILANLLWPYAALSD
jgi:hypothetical protein